MAWPADRSGHPESVEREAPLVLYTDKSDPEGAEALSPSGIAGCENVRLGLRFLAPDGTLHFVRCGSPNKCGFCAYMAAAEDGMVILQDALEFEPPRVALTLTTRAAHTPPATFRRDVEQLLKWLRKQVDVEYFQRVEFTTGKGTRSGGHRRIHAHNLVKRLTPEDAAQLAPQVSEFWRSRTGAHRVELAELRSAAGAMHYITEHFSKASQRPPRGWSGRRTRYSRGYFSKPNVDRREQAREVLRDRRTERLVGAQLDEHGLIPQDLGYEYDEFWDGHLDAARERAMRMRLVRVANLPTEFDADGLPSAWELTVLGDA